MKVKTNLVKKSTESALKSKKISSKNILKKAKNVIKGKKNNSKELKKKLVSPETKPKVTKLKSKVNRSIQRNRGVVYVGHIPHGFYEEQMKEYFSQFGKVTNVRVSRSKNTGRSRGYGFVEFLHPEVAKVAAESMHNYLMFGRLVKTKYIAPEEQHDRYFAGIPWTETKFKKLTTRRKSIAKVNKNPPKEQHSNYLKSVGKKMNKLEDKLKSLGVKLDILLDYSKLKEEA